MSLIMPTEDLNIQINKIFENNKIKDLNKFMSKRQCLNSVNMYMTYLFHLVQSAGILTTTIAAGYNKKELVWVGVGLNIFATLIHSYENINNTISSKLLQDIKNIRNNNYIDEDLIIDVDEIVKKKNVSSNI